MKFLIKNFIEHTVATDVDALKIIPFLVNENQKITSLVKSIIDKQKENPKYDYASNEQAEINKLVYKLYGLNKENIEEVETWYKRRYPNLNS
jgi:translation initiation factor 2 gamma subunit (eIF-2gamma)